MVSIGLSYHYNGDTDMEHRIDDVAKNDKVVLVNKNSKPQNIIISYDRYCRLKENGADI